MFKLRPAYSLPGSFLDVSTGVERTPGELENSRSTKALYTCRVIVDLHMCTKYVIYIYAGMRHDDLLVGLLPSAFQHIFSFEGKKRCDDNPQTSVTHFGKNNKLHLDNSKQTHL